MKNSKIISLSIILFMLVGMLTLNAATASVSVREQKSTVTTGSKITVTVTASGYGNSFDLTITASGAAFGSAKWTPVEPSSKSFTFNTRGTGTAIIEVKGESADWGNANGEPEEIPQYASTRVKVVSASQPDPKPTNPKPTNPGTGGSNSGSDRDEREKEEAKNDPAKAEELKKAEEEAEKKDKENTPLFTDIKITSASDKKKGEVLETVKAEKSIFDYTYTLPKRIDSFAIEVKELDKDVVLTYDKEFSFKEDEKSIKIPIKAKKGDISQDITLEIKKNEEVDAELKLEDSSYLVYRDEVLDKYMKSNGFEAVKFKLGDVETVKFKKNKLELILLVDDKNNAKWVSIDENNNIQFEVDLVKNAAGKLIVVAELTDNMKFEKIHGEGYTAKTYELDKEIKEMDQSLVFDTTYKSWTLVDVDKDKTSFLDSFTVSAEENETINEIVYAAKEDGTFDLVNNNDSDELATIMMVSFDQGATGNFQLYAMIATGISVMLLIICFVLLYVLKKTRMQLN